MRKPKPTERDPLLAAREATHGDFGETARIAQRIKEAMRASPNWAALPDWAKEAMEMKAAKLARFLCGDVTNPEHLTDDIGYARLVLERMATSKAARRIKGR